MKREKEGGRESVVSVDLACKEELNLMLVEASQGAVGLSLIVPFCQNSVGKTSVINIGTK